MRISLSVMLFLLPLIAMLAGCDNGSTGTITPADGDIESVETDNDGDADIEDSVDDDNPDAEEVVEGDDIESDVDADPEPDIDEASEVENEIPDTACVWDRQIIDSWAYYPYQLACETFPGMTVFGESPGVWRSVSPFPRDATVPTSAMLPLDNGGLLGVTYPTSISGFSSDGVLQKQTAYFTKGIMGGNSNHEIAVNVSALQPGYPEFLSLYGGIYEQDGDRYRLSDPEVCIDDARVCSQAEQCQSGEMMGNHYYKLIATGDDAYPWITFSRSAAGTSTDRILLYDAANAAWRFEPVSGLPACIRQFTDEDGELYSVAPDPITGTATRNGRIILALSAHETYWAAVQPDFTACGDVCSQVYEFDLDTLNARPLGFVPGLVRFIRRNSANDDLYLVWNQVFDNPQDPASGGYGITLLAGDELTSMPMFDTSHGMVQDVTHLPGDRLMALSFKGHVLEYLPDSQQWRYTFSVGSDTEDSHATQMVASVPDNNLWIDVVKGYAGGYRHMTPEGIALDRGVHSGIQGIVEARLDGPLGYGAEIRDMQQDAAGNLYLLVGLDDTAYQTNMLWLFALVDNKLVLLYESIPLSGGSAGRLYVDDREIIIGFGIGILHLRMPEDIVTRRAEPLLTEDVFLAFHRRVHLIAAADNRLFATSRLIDTANQNLNTDSLYYYEYPEWHKVGDIDSFDSSVEGSAYYFYDEDLEDPGVMWLVKKMERGEVYTLRRYAIDAQAGNVALQQEIPLPTDMHLTRMGGELQLFDKWGRYRVQGDGIETIEAISYIETLFPRGCLEDLETPAVTSMGVYDCIDDGFGNPLYIFTWHEGIYIGRWDNIGQQWLPETAIQKIFGLGTGWLHRLKRFGNRYYYYGSRSNLMEYTLPEPVE